MGSGLGALRLALRGLGVGASTPVVVPAYSCVALANAVLSLGGTPVPVDCASGDINSDPERIISAARNFGANTVIVVHTFGQPVPVIPLIEAGLDVIEDCSHGMPWSSESTAQPLSGTVGILSFYATKLIAGGEGGGIVSNDLAFLETVQDIRNYADKPPDSFRLNDKMNDMEAALAECQLHRLPDIIATRAQLAAYYNEAFAKLHSENSSMVLPPNSPSRVWYRYTVRLPGHDLEETIVRLADQGVGADKPVIPWVDYKDYPEVHRANTEVLSLPLYPTLKSHEQETVVVALKTVLQI